MNDITTVFSAIVNAIVDCFRRLLGMSLWGLSLADIFVFGIIITLICYIMYIGWGD